MGTILEATMPTEQFALTDTFDRVPGAEFETVRIVAHEATSVLPFLWASAPDPDGLHDALTDDDTTKNVSRLSRNDDRILYWMEWRAQVRAIIDILLEQQGTLLNANGRRNRWKFRVFFPDHDAVSATYDFCEDYGIDLSIRRVNGVTDLIDHDGIDLSEKQREALTTAYETDYYSVPRGMTLEGLADELSVSHQALSERLRRGHQRLIADTLCDTPESQQNQS